MQVPTGRSRAGTARWIWGLAWMLAGIGHGIASPSAGGTQAAPPPAAVPASPVPASSPTQSDRLPSAPLHEQVLSLPGDRARPVTLQVTLFTPDGPGPFPLAVVNHGSDKISPALQPRYRETFSAYYFLSRGYAVALPMMRGYAGSGGKPLLGGCNVVATGLGNARDIAAVIDALAAMPMIDATRIVVAGQSFGGWNTLALGTLGHAGVRGLVNFAGGMRESDCPTQDQSLQAGAATLGRDSTVPSIWFYGQNDQVFPPDTWRAMFAHYTGAGGRAELVDVGKIRDDAHQLLSYKETLPIWTPRVDAFLARIGLPSAETYPGYLPTPLPPSTGFAALDDAAAVPYLTDKGREIYRKFLNMTVPRALVVAPDGFIVAINGGYDPIARALALCRKKTSGCQLYAADTAVVWTGHQRAAAPQPSTRVQHAAVAAGATARLNFVRSVNPDCSSRGMPKIRLLEKPQHGAAQVTQREDFPKFPQDAPAARCNAIRVPGQSVEYTPTAGFTGDDSLTFEVTTLDERRLVFHVDIAVK
jgi:dienelactone hydrolase